MSTVTWERLAALVDSAAALVDERSQPPRQGDSDEGRGLLLDAPVPNRWPAVFALGEALIGRLDWWPPSPAGAESTLVGALAPGTREHPGPARAAAVSLRRRRDSAAPLPIRSKGPRSGAGATAARTDSSASPRMPTPMPCR